MPSDRLEYERAWKAANREKVLAYKAAYRERNRERIRAEHAVWRAANPGHMDSYRQKYREANRDLIAEINARWQRNNPDRTRATWQRRHAAKLQRTPPWYGELDDLVMSEAHDLARRRAGAWDVDHTIPMQGELVSGLHVWNNIQVIPATINRSKGAKFDPELHNAYLIV